MTASVRPMAPRDLAAVERIHAARAADDPPIGERVSELMRGRGVALVGIDESARVVGFLVGEVRSWEFGSPPTGWIFALGVEPRAERRGLGAQLLDAAIARFAALGVRSVRTMVRKDDLALLRFFRSGRFQAGTYQELEREL
jgi:ribosomal protein S18 acetylase RimI-like enzyme